MPGETAAPGTASGKTGTPTAQTAGTRVHRDGQRGRRELERRELGDRHGRDHVERRERDAAGQRRAGRRHEDLQRHAEDGAAAATVTATDVTDGTKTANTSPSMTVNAGAFAKLQTAGARRDGGARHRDRQDRARRRAQTAGTRVHRRRCNAVDANWNVVVRRPTRSRITSTDANATLPANAALVAGTEDLHRDVEDGGQQDGDGDRRRPTGRRRRTRARR